MILILCPILRPRECSVSHAPYLLAPQTRPGPIGDISSPLDNRPADRLVAYLLELCGCDLFIPFVLVGVVLESKTTVGSMEFFVGSSSLYAKGSTVIFGVGVHGGQQFEVWVSCRRFVVLLVTRMVRPR